MRPPSRPVIDAFREWVTLLPETLGVFVVSGGEDFLVHVPCRTTTPCTPSSSTTSPSGRSSRVRTSVVYEHIRSRVIEVA